MSNPSRLHGVSAGTIKSGKSKADTHLIVHEVQKNDFLFFPVDDYTLIRAWKTENAEVVAPDDEIVHV